MSFQWAQNWILPREEDNCPATGQNPFGCLQARTLHGHQLRTTYRAVSRQTDPTGSKVPSKGCSFPSLKTTEGKVELWDSGGKGVQDQVTGLTEMKGEVVSRRTPKFLEGSGQWGEDLGGWEWEGGLPLMSSKASLSGEKPGSVPAAPPPRVLDTPIKELQLPGAWTNGAQTKKWWMIRFPLIQTIIHGDHVDLCSQSWK